MQTANQFYKKYFGQKVYKISLDASCTCPNRDGSLGFGGCIFCSATGSGDFTSDKKLSISQQVEAAKKLVDAKFSRKSAREKSAENHKYIAYFQNFTNTYGNPEILYAKWKEALACPQIVGLAIATRPDCISNRILEIFAELSKITFLQIELGIQTSDDITADFLNRGYKTEVYGEAIRKIHQASEKIHVVTHIIFGLPKPAKDYTQGTDPTCNLQLESTEQMMNTVTHAIKQGSDGIKITVLYVLQNTKLAQYYTQGLFPVLEMEEYFELIKQALKLMPENMVIHRLTGDPPKSQLIAPTWTTDKKRVLNKINTLLK